MSLTARLLLDLGGVEKRGDDRCRSDAHGHSGPDKLVAALLVGALGVIAICHSQTSMAFVRGLEVA